MSDNIYPFNKGNDEEPESCCPSCDLAHEYLHYILDTLADGTIDDLFGVLRSLVDEAGKIALVNHLQEEIHHNIKLLDHLEGCCGDEDCDC